VIAISLVLITSLIAWYLLHYLPQIDHRNELIVQREKCREAGEKYYGRKREEWNQDMLSMGLHQEESEFVFNPRLNACLVYSEITQFQVDFKSSVFEKTIKDVYQNKILFNWIRDCSKANCISEIDFDKKKNELFNEDGQ